MALLFFLISLFCFCRIEAQNGLPPFSSPFSQTQMMVADAGLNPASASRLKAPEASVYSERKAMIQELQDYSLFMGLPLAKGFIYSSLLFSRFEGYQHSRISLGYGRNLGSISIGTSVSLDHKKVHSYNPEKGLLARSAILVKLSSQWVTGLTFSYSEDIKEGFRYAGGLGLDLSSSLHFFILLHNWYFKPISLLGIRMKEDKILLSFSFDPSQHFFQLGCGVLFKQFSVGIQSGYQPFLGFTPSLFLQFRKEKE